MNCQLAWNAERNRYECKCGSWSTSPTARMLCRSTQPARKTTEPPVYVEPRAVPAEHEETWSRLRQIKSLWVEMAKWIYHGCPTRTKAEVAAIHEICSSCDRFVPQSKGGPRCSICGCRTAPPDAADVFTLKPLMATTRCPLDPPKWPASTPS